MKPRQVVEVLNRVLEMLDEMQQDSAVPDYFAEKAEVLVEDIETLLGNGEIEDAS